MKITILTSSSSWLTQYLDNFALELKNLGHIANIVNNHDDIKEGDIAFFLSCFEFVNSDKLKLHKNNLVIHESKLPEGKGWSPMTWQILEGKNEIVFSLFEASSKLDSGDIYIQKTVQLDGTELVEQWRDIQAITTFELCLEFVKNYPKVLQQAKKQEGNESFYKRRGPKDSKLDINKSIKEQFNLLRTVDNENYPAFFELNGCKYVLKIEKDINKND